jgi:hypothetical protein
MQISQPYHPQGRLNACARWAVAQGPHENRDPMLIYVCCVQQTVCVPIDVFVETIVLLSNTTQHRFQILLFVALIRITFENWNS